MRSISHSLLSSSSLPVCDSSVALTYRQNMVKMMFSLQSPWWAIGCAYLLVCMLMSSMDLWTCVCHLGTFRVSCLREPLGIGQDGSRKQDFHVGRAAAEVFRSTSVDHSRKWMSTRRNDVGTEATLSSFFFAQVFSQVCQTLANRVLPSAHTCFTEPFNCFALSGSRSGY